jgi:3-isopropylmalate/(R)-2-methylmalate dehydratase small subunit
MKPFTTHTGVAAPLDRADVDTDQLIPKQFLKRIERTGYGPFLFNDWRYAPDGSERPDFILNQEPFRQASVLIGGANFGCGSSREHAVWALADFGFRAVIAPSFADIFSSNSLRCGFLPVQLDDATVSELMARASSEAPLSVTIDLEAETVVAGTLKAHFDIEPFAQHCLLNGLDEIALSEQHKDEITDYEQARSPWLPRVEAKSA